jgi:putative transposase
MITVFVVVRTKDLNLAERYGVPLRTARSWIRRGVRPVVTCADFDEHAELMAVKVARLQRRVEVLIALVRLLTVLVRISGAKLNGKRLPEGEDKLAVARAVQRAVQAMPVRLALRAIGLSSARYHAWQRAESVCELGDENSCPKTHPSRLTAKEVRKMRDMVTSGDFRHMSTRALALHAQRIGRVFASPGTWWRRARLHGWVRPRLRVHPPKPKLGIRASRPNELWHIDVSLIRLLDGTRVYIHGVIDNFSMKLLAWEVATKLDPTTTCRVLIAAGSMAIRQTKSILGRDPNSRRNSWKRVV